MSARLLAALLGLAAFGFTQPLAAADNSDTASRQLKADPQFQLRPDRAYLLLGFETETDKLAAFLLREPSKEEMDAYDRARSDAYQREVAKRGEDKAGPIENFAFAYQGASNLYSLRSDKPYDKAAGIALMEVPPGSYVLYGQGWHDMLMECFCFGTVKFDARAGEITDLGTMLFAQSYKASAFPELADETSLGSAARLDYRPIAVAVRPAKAGGEAPVGLPQGRIVPAEYHAQGTFLETNVLLTERLAAMPGVLGYRAGRVIDGRTGQELPDN